MNKVRGIPLKKGSQAAKDYMANLRSMKAISKGVKIAKDSKEMKPLKIKK